MLERREFFYLLSLYAVVTGLLFWVATLINGPFIFFDENTYLWLSYEIYQNLRFHGFQYNPLYPLLIAPTFLIYSPLGQFYAIKLINIVTYSSVIFPIYLIAKKLLPKSSKFLYLTTLTALISPICGYILIVWAEPVYYAAICWAYYFLINYFEEKKIKYAFIAGVFIGLGYLAKQSSFFLAIAFLICLFIPFNGIKNIDFKGVIALTVGVAILSFPWIIRNALDGQGVGYNSMFAVLHDGWIKDPGNILNNVVSGIGHSLSYWTIIYCGAGFFVLIIDAFSFPKGESSVDSVASNTSRVALVHTVFLMLVSEIFLVAYGKIDSANGRYVDVIYPVATILIVRWLSQNHSLRPLTCIYFAIFSFILVLFFSPLLQIEAYGVVNNSGVSFIDFFWSDDYLWERKSPIISHKIGLALIVCFFTYLVFSLKRYAVRLYIALAIFVGAGAIYKVVELGGMAEVENRVMLHIKNRGISLSNVAIDKDLENISMQARWLFWNVSDVNSLKFITPTELGVNFIFEFGTRDTELTQSKVEKIWAPWNVESGYRESWGRGFSDLSSLNSGNCPNFSRQGDFVFDAKPGKFIIRLPEGSYEIKISSADSRCITPGTNFNLSVSNGPSLNINGQKNSILPIKITQKSENIELIFSPSDGFVWAIDNLSITSKSSKVERDGFEYLISKRLLSLPYLFDIGGYRLYSLKKIKAEDGSHR